MKQQCEHTFVYFLLIYILKLTWNDKYILLSFIVENVYLVLPTQLF